MYKYLKRMIKSDIIIINTDNIGDCKYGTQSDPLCVLRGKIQKLF